VNRYFLLFANCIPVKGAVRSIICDLERGFYVFIPTFLADLFIEKSPLTLQEMLNRHGTNQPDELITYLETLMSHDLGHYCDNPMNFPRINKNFKTPFTIQDCILELSEINLKNINYIFKSLTNLGCQILELRSYDSFSLSKIQLIIDLLKSTRIRSVEIFAKHENSISADDYIDFSAKNPIINKLVLHSCNPGTITPDNIVGVIFTEQILSDSNCCGNISKEDFIINLPFYLDGLKNNTCLSRKLTITGDGLIKNCPSMAKNFGSINNFSMENVVNSGEFQELWKINKDEINVCKDCEFRYICSDCRAFVSDTYSKPQKCNYNPYTATYEI